MDDDDPLLDDYNDIESPPSQNIDQKSIESIREWFIWSYLNVLIGGVILGITAIGCSLRTNKFKRRENYSKAYKWSYVTLVVNCLSTLCGLSTIGYFIYSYFHNILNEEKQLMKKKFTLTPFHPL